MFQKRCICFRAQMNGFHHPWLTFSPHRTERRFFFDLFVAGNNAHWDHRRNYLKIHCSQSANKNAVITPKIANASPRACVASIPSQNTS